MWATTIRSMHMTIFIERSRGSCNWNAQSHRVNEWGAEVSTYSVMHQTTFPLLNPLYHHKHTQHKTQRPKTQIWMACSVRETFCVWVSLRVALSRLQILQHKPKAKRRKFPMQTGKCLTSQVLHTEIWTGCWRKRALWALMGEVFHWVKTKP